MNSYIYSPNSWCIEDHIIVYDIILSSCKKKIYIVFNTILHVLNGNDKSFDLDKRTLNYVFLYRKVLNINGIFDLNRDLSCSLLSVDGVNNNCIESTEWIECEDYKHRFIYVITVKDMIMEDHIDIEIRVKNTSKVIHCNFVCIYSQVGRLAAVIHFKNENEFLDKWISHYIKLGVEMIYIYNNNPDNIDNYDKLIMAYGSRIVFLHWGYHFDLPNGKSQIACFNQSLNLLKNRFKWVIYTDIDEYIIINDKTNITRTLTELLETIDDREVGSISFKCMWFGCSHSVDYNSDNFLNKLVYTNNISVSKFTKGNYQRHIRNVKCIHNTSLVDIIGNHLALEYNGKSVILTEDKIRFNHYFTLSTWGRDRLFSMKWENNNKYKYKKKCNCVELCKVKNTDIIDIYYGNK